MRQSWNRHPRHTGAAKRREARRLDLGFESLEDRRVLVISVAGADINDDAASLLAYGGPGDPSLPGFDNVGRGSSGNTSVVYLGGGWVLTANHISLNSNGVFFGNVNYQVDLNSVQRLHNPDNSLADLKMFKIYGDPGLPAILPSYLATAPPADHVFMIGNGKGRGAEQLYWQVDQNQNPWEWTPISEPAFPGPQHKSGYEFGSRNIRWAENNADLKYDGDLLAGVAWYITQFDHVDYTSNPVSSPLPQEGQASSGDSGGAVFALVDGVWVLSGIMITVSSDYSGQPNDTTVFGFQTLAADLSYYRDEILSIAGVVGRHVFYNQSAFDGGLAAINAADDGAIAPDKVAYLPGGGLITPDSMTSYARGINGIMIDLASDHGTISVDDFTFRMSETGFDANNAPTTWQLAPAPSDFMVREGAGDGGSDRVEIVWDSDAVRNAYLYVTVEGNDAAGGNNTNTGLAISDTFIFGSKVGDTFLTTSDLLFTTGTSDEISARNNFGVGATITNLFDFDRNTFSGSATDQIVSRNNFGLLARINVPSPAAPLVALPASAGDDGDADVTFALVTQDQPVDADPLLPRQLPREPRAEDGRRASRERVFEQMISRRDDEILRRVDKFLDSVHDDDWIGFRALAAWRAKLRTHRPLTLP